jgi:hypothetical protein
METALGFQNFSAALGMAALARKFGCVRRGFAAGAAVFILAFDHAGTGRVFALFIAGHDSSISGFLSRPFERRTKPWMQLLGMMELRAPDSGHGGVWH